MKVIEPKFSIVAKDTTRWPGNGIVVWLISNLLLSMFAPSMAMMTIIFLL